MNETDKLDKLEQSVSRVMKRLTHTSQPDSLAMQLPLAQLRLAHALHRSDVTLGETMGALKVRLGVGNSALTQAGDRLIHNGLAERLDDPNDRRVVRMRLTEKGRYWVDDIRLQRKRRIEEILTHLTPSQAKEFTEAVFTLDRLTTFLRRNTSIDANAPEETIAQIQAVTE